MSTHGTCFDNGIGGHCDIDCEVFLDGKCEEPDGNIDHLRSSDCDDMDPIDRGEMIAMYESIDHKKTTTNRCRDCVHRGDGGKICPMPGMYSDEGSGRCKHLQTEKESDMSKPFERFTATHKTTCLGCSKKIGIEGVCWSNTVFVLCDDCHRKEDEKSENYGKPSDWVEYKGNTKCFHCRDIRASWESREEGGELANETMCADFLCDSCHEKYVVKPYKRTQEPMVITACECGNRARLREMPGLCRVDCKSCGEFVESTMGYRVAIEIWNERKPIPKSPKYQGKCTYPHCENTATLETILGSEREICHICHSYYNIEPGRYSPIPEGGPCRDMDGVVLTLERPTCTGKVGDLFHVSGRIRNEVRGLWEGQNPLKWSESCFSLDCFAVPAAVMEETTVVDGLEPLRKCGDDIAGKTLVVVAEVSASGKTVPMGTECVAIRKMGNRNVYVDFADDSYGKGTWFIDLFALAPEEKPTCCKCDGPANMKITGGMGDYICENCYDSNEKPAGVTVTFIDGGLTKEEAREVAMDIVRRRRKPRWEDGKMPTTTMEDEMEMVHESTHSCLLKFPCGERVEILPPEGEGWKETVVWDESKWPHRYSRTVADLALKFSHEKGKLLMLEYGKRLLEENARFVSLSEWNRRYEKPVKPVVETYKNALAPEPPPSNFWVENHEVTWERDESKDLPSKRLFYPNHHERPAEPKWSGIWLQGHAPAAIKPVY